MGYCQKISVDDQKDEDGEIVKDGFYVHPHLLRHTYITELCAAGLDIKKVQYLAGHETPDMTLKIYAHVVDNRPEDLIEKVNGIFNRPRSGSNSGSTKKFKQQKTKKPPRK